MKIFSREDHRNTSRFATNARRVHSYIFKLSKLNSLLRRIFE
jgi:hypothetical protein